MLKTGKRSGGHVLTEKYKNFNHHDIVPICIDCHENYELIANIYKKEL